MVPIQGGDAISTAEEEVLPPVQDIIPRKPDAKSDFHWSSEAMVEVFRSSMMAKRLAEFKAMYGLPDQVELIPSNLVAFSAYVHAQLLLRHDAESTISWRQVLGG